MPTYRAMSLASMQPRQANQQRHKCFAPNKQFLALVDLELLHTVGCRCLGNQLVSTWPQLRGPDIFPGHIPPGHFPLPDNFPSLHSLIGLYFPHHYYTAVNNIKRLPLACTQLIEADRLGSGVRVSASYQKIPPPCGSVSGGYRMIQRGNCWKFRIPAV